MGKYAEITFVDTKGKQSYGTDKVYFTTFADLKSQLKDDYGIDMNKHRKSKMYVDTKSGTKEVGYVLNRWGKYDDTGKRFPEEVWISFYKSSPLQLSEIKASKK